MYQTVLNGLKVDIFIVNQVFFLIFFINVELFNGTNIIYIFYLICSYDILIYLRTIFICIKH